MKNELLSVKKNSIQSINPFFYDKIEKMIFDFKINKKQEAQLFSFIEEVVLNSNNQFPLSAAADNRYIIIKADGFYEKVEVNSIIVVKSKRDYLCLTTGQKEYKFKGTMKDFAYKLPNKFIQINRGTIINSSRIEGFNNSLITINNEDIAISATYKKDTIAKLNNILLKTRYYNPK
jgi:DNA-binding LytR/AlgR family response regulator